MTNPARKRRNQHQARELPEECIKAKPDLGPWENLTVSDCALIKQAVRERRDICEASRVRLADALFNTTKSDNDSLFLSAANVIIEMTRQDQNARLTAKRYQRLIAQQQQKQQKSNRKKK